MIISLTEFVSIINLIQLAFRWGVDKIKIDKLIVSSKKKKQIWSKLVYNYFQGWKLFPTINWLPWICCQLDIKYKTNLINLYPMLYDDDDIK